MGAMRTARLAAVLLSVIATPAFAQAECDTAAATRAWAKCTACHTLKPGEHQTAGPSLHGLFGRKAGSVAGYRFSKAFQNLEMVWTRENFDAFIAKPQAVTPGTKMAFAGLRNPADRAALACFIEAAAIRQKNPSREGE
jgi:cytochrome c